jgi:hypothetical protein
MSLVYKDVCNNNNSYILDEMLKYLSNIDLIYYTSNTKLVKDTFNKFCTKFLKLYKKYIVIDDKNPVGNTIEINLIENIKYYTNKRHGISQEINYIASLCIYSEIVQDVFLKIETENSDDMIHRSLRDHNGVHYNDLIKSEKDGKTLSLSNIIHIASFLLNSNRKHLEIKAKIVFNRDLSTYQDIGMSILSAKKLSKNNDSST